MSVGAYYDPHTCVFLRFGLRSARSTLETLARLVFLYAGRCLHGTIRYAEAPWSPSPLRRNMRSILCLLALTACSEAGPSSKPVEIADSQVAMRRGDGEPPLTDASTEAPLALDMSDAAAWLATDTFSIGLEETGCFGTCSSFSVRIDGDGHVSYRGAEYTARPGFFEVDVPVADAQALRRSLIDANFLGLRDQYTSEADGCRRVATDSPYYTFTLETPEQTKRVRWYLGCDWPELYALLRPIEEQIKRTTTVGRFLTPHPNGVGCASQSRVEWVDTFVITDTLGLSKSDLGLLHFGAIPTWTVTTCDGEPVAEGVYASDGGTGRILLPIAESPAPFEWPGLDAPQGAALLRRTSLPAWISLSTLELNDEHSFWAFEGDRCGLDAP